MGRVPTELLRGFSSFVEGARLLWRVKSLRALAALSTLITAVWIATVLLVLQGMERGRLVALGPDTSAFWSVALVTAGVFVLLFAFPSLGPVSVTLQQRAAESARAVLLGTAIAERDSGWWFQTILGHLAGIYRRVLIVAASLAFAGLIAHLLVPERMPFVERVVQVPLLLALLALSALVRSLDDFPSVTAVFLRRWPEVLGYVTGSWCLSLFGLGPWFLILDAVSAEVFRARLRDPERRIDWHSALQPEKVAAYRRVPEHVVDRVRRHFDAIRDTIVYDARLPHETRFEYVPLVSARYGEEQIGALLLADDDGRFDPKGILRYWVIVSFDVPFDTRDLPRGGDRFAGPFNLSPATSPR